MNRVVFAYSGSPATAGAVAWLGERYAAEVVTLTLDLGEGRELEPVRDRALALGATRAHVLDVHDAFVRGYLLRALTAGALYDRARSLVPALTRPMIAERLVEVARIEHTSYVAHACAEDDARISVAIGVLDPALEVIAVSRERSIVAGLSSVPPSTAAVEPAMVDLAFERGNPVALNGIAMPPIDLMRSLEIIARAHGIETLRVLSTAHACLQHAVAPDASDELRQRYVAIVDRGDWFTPSRRSLDAAIATTQERVCGRVRLKLFHGACELGGCEPAVPPKRLPVLA